MKIPEPLMSQIEEAFEKTFQKPVASVIPTRHGSFTEYVITGKLRDVFSAIEALFDQYDSRGYGTKVRSLEMGDNGSYIAQMWRANSCD